MKRNLLKVGGVLALAAIGAFATTSTAEASIKMRITINGGAPLVIEDNDANDDAPGADTIAYNDSLADGGFHLELGNIFPDTVLPELAHLHVSALSQGALDMKVEFTKTDVNFETLQLLISWGGILAAQAGNTMSYAAYYDLGNAEFATTTLIGSLSAPLGDFSGETSPTAAPGSTPYSFTQVFTVHHGGRGGFSSVDMNIENIPEPATMSLLGLGLVGVAALRRRRAARS